MTEVPETKYAKSGDLHIAYQVVGEGATDLVYIRNWISHVEFMWQVPPIARLLSRLASFSRLIVFDPRGVGLSDPISLDELPPLEERIDDIRAVLDAAESSKAAILGGALAGPLAALFAATEPTRTTALVLQDTAARFVQSDDYPYGVPAEALPAAEQRMMEEWGGPGIWSVSGQPTPDPGLNELYLSYNRMALSPRSAAKVWRMSMEADIRDVLAAIRVPTLVIHTVGRAPAELSRYLADHIDGARLVETEDTGPSRVSPVADALDVIEEFLTGVKPQPESDRVLATVLFTDIVGSTERAAELGDRKWTDLLDRHNEIVARCIARFGGRHVDSAGDGVLATFDGPARAVRCAVAIRDALRRIGLAVRAGLHTGEIELRGQDIGGIAVHTGQRVSALAGSSEVLVTRTVVDLVAGSGLEFDDRGEHELKGVPGQWRLFAVRP